MQLKAEVEFREVHGTRRSLVHALPMIAAGDVIFPAAIHPRTCHIGSQLPIPTLPGHIDGGDGSLQRARDMCGASRCQGTVAMDAQLLHRVGEVAAVA